MNSAREPYLAAPTAPLLPAYQAPTSFWVRVPVRVRSLSVPDLPLMDTPKMDQALRASLPSPCHLSKSRFLVP